MDDASDLVYGFAKLYVETYRWQVVPIIPGQKRPALDDWVNEAARELETVESWWLGTYRGYGIGVVTGEASGIFVVDIDDNGLDKHGEDTWHALLDELGPVEDTATVLTGSGGRHLYYRWPGFNPPQTLGEHIDVRGRGRMVVAPPSIHPNGNAYVWEQSLRPSMWLPESPLPAFSHVEHLRATAKRGGALSELSGADSERLAEFRAVLEHFDFARHRIDAQGNEHWTRPGKDAREGSSLTLYATPDDVHATVYSSSVRGVEVSQPYLPKTLARALAKGYGKPDGSSSVPDGLTIVAAASVKIRRQLFLMKHRLPLGGAVIVAGEPGLGKTTAVIELAARATRGELDGDVHEPISVVYASAEDSEASTLVPRFMTAGADLTRVHFVHVDGFAGGLVIPEHLDELKAAMQSVNGRMLVLDPFSAHLPGGNFDSHRDQHVRQAIAPLAAAMDELAATCVGIMHWSKAPTLNALDRVLGSRAFTAAARAVLAVGELPDEPGTKVLVLAKSNLGRLDVPALAFVVEQRFVDDPAGGFPYETSGVRWIGDRDGIHANDLFKVRESDELAAARATAKDVLRTVLSDGPVPVKTLEEARRASGISDITMRRARKDLRVIAEQVRDADKIVGWQVRFKGAIATDLGAHPKISEINEHLAFDALTRDNNAGADLGSQMFTLRDEDERLDPGAHSDTKRAPSENGHYEMLREHFPGIQIDEEF